MLKGTPSVHHSIRDQGPLVPLVTPRSCMNQPLHHFLPCERIIRRQVRSRIGKHGSAAGEAADTATAKVRHSVHSETPTEMDTDTDKDKDTYTDINKTSGRA